MTKKINGMSLNVLGVKDQEYAENVMVMGWMRMTESVTLVMDQPFARIVTVQEKFGFNKTPLYHYIIFDNDSIY